MNTPENNLLTVVTHQEVTSLYKTFLEIVEDIRYDTQIMMSKITAQCGPEFAQQINFFTPEKYEHIRKRVLDKGNECERKLLSLLDFFEFIINKEKIEEAAKQKRTITKKVIVNPITMIE